MNLPQPFASYVEYVPYAALVILLLFGYFGFWQNLGKWSKSESGMYGPMSITLKTDKTPEQVRLEAAAARRTKRMAMTVLVVAAWLVLYLFNDIVAMSLLNGLARFAKQVLVALFDLVAMVIGDVGAESGAL